MSWSRWIRTVEIAPGLDAAGGDVIGGHVEALLRTGCKIVHVDVGDGLTASLAQLTTLVPLVHRYEGVVDLHLTGGDPLLLFGAVAATGADSVTFGAEAVGDVRAAVEAARDTGLQVGVAVAPDTDYEAAAQEAQQADLVLCDGRSEGLASVVRRLRLALPSTVALEIEDPPVDETGSLRDLYEGGARVFVVREAIFAREDLPRAYRRLVQEFA